MVSPAPPTPEMLASEAEFDEQSFADTQSEISERTLAGKEPQVPLVEPIKWMTLANLSHQLDISSTLARQLFDDAPKKETALKPRRLSQSYVDTIGVVSGTGVHTKYPGWVRISDACNRMKLNTSTIMAAVRSGKVESQIVEGRVCIPETLVIKGEADQWLTVVEASRAIGTSPEKIRMHMKTLPATQVFENIGQIRISRIGLSKMTFTKVKAAP